MKPTKNIVYCRNSNRKKMLFESEGKANNFIKFNSSEIKAESGYAPERSYFCLFCGGWHVTSMKEKWGLTKNEQIFQELVKSKSCFTVKSNKKNEIDKLKSELEKKINEMDNVQRFNFISNNIEMLKNEIEKIKASDPAIKNDELKNIQIKLDIFYVLRKQFGINIIKKKSKIEITRENEMEEWRIWAEKKLN